MTFHIKIYFLLTSIILINACTDPKVAALEERWAKHDWSQSQRKPLYLDINNDGVKERALIGTGDTIVVAVYIKEQVHLIDFVEIFTNHPTQHNAICGTSAILSLEKQNKPLIDQAGLLVEGYKACPECQGLKLTDNQCHPFSIYWDHEQQNLRWWRHDKRKEKKPRKPPKYH